jgi:hypothetical protein
MTLWNIYLDYCDYCRSVGVEPMPFDMWVAVTS